MTRGPLLLFALLSGTTLMAKTPAVLTEAIRTARDRDTFAAFEQLESKETATKVASLYSQSVFVIYGEKDVPLMVAFGRRGIAFALAAAKAEGVSNEVATDLRATAKTIAFNVAANTWPGWNDEGIVISTTDRALGLDCAKLNLRLAIELDKPADKVSAAHWLLGAQQMANGDAARAVESFREAAKFATKAERPVDRMMNNGYAALAGTLLSEPADESTKAFDVAVKELREEGSEDATFYAAQLETARAVFVTATP